MQFASALAEALYDQLDARIEMGNGNGKVQIQNNNTSGGIFENQRTKIRSKNSNDSPCFRESILDSSKVSMN